MDVWNQIYFTPHSLGRFPVLFFSILVSVYLLLHPARSVQSITAGLYFVFSSLFHFGFFFAYSVNHPIGAYGYYLTALSPIGVSILVQFAYFFPRDHLPKERKIIGWITFTLSILSCLDYFYFAHISGVGAFTFGYGSFYISRSVPFLIIGFYFWSIFIFIRKTMYHSKTYHASHKATFSYILYPGGKEALSCRNFAILNLLELLNTSILTSGLLFRAFPYIQFLTLMNIVFFIITSLYVVLFLKYLVGSIPITFKVIHFSLVSNLLLCIIAGNILTIFADQSFHTLRLEQIFRVFPYLNTQNLQDLGEIKENTEFIVHFPKEGSHKILFQNPNLSIPQNLNLWSQYPGLMEYDSKPVYINFEKLKLHVNEEFYLRVSNTNLQFYPVLHNNELYGVVFNFLDYRKYIHPQIKSLFPLYIFVLLLNFLLLPFYLSKNFSEPFQEILSGIYQSKEILLLPPTKNTPKDELDVLRETIFQLRDAIENKEINRKENLEGEEKREDEEDSPANEIILKESTIQKIKMVETYLKENFSYELSREGLASMVNLSPGRLGKYFKLSTGKKISEYTNQLRIEKAKLLLSESQKTVIEIAFEVGFESLRTFNRVFFSEIGMNPGQFRQKISDNLKPGSS